MAIKKVKKMLPVRLTNDELLKAGQDMANENRAHQAALDRKKEVVAQVTAEIEEHRTRVQTLGNLIANGYEYRQVECHVLVDRDRGWVTITRVDTGEVVADRAMRDDEAQGELDV